jgi:putative flavoprotein involved in K+ transport
VLVVGGGNSGFQIAEELAATRQVDLSIATRYPMPPQRLAGRDLFWWLTRLGLLRVTVTSRPGRRMSRRDFVIGTNRRRLERAGVRFRPRLVDAEGRTVRFADHSLLEDVGVVVWATGYRPDYAWIHIPEVVREGHVVHRRGVTEVPGLYFLGLSWQHTRGSALLGFVSQDAAYLAITSPPTSAPLRRPRATCGRSLADKRVHVITAVTALPDSRASGEASPVTAALQG